MDMTSPAAEPQFSQPVRQIAQMVLVLALVSVGGWAIYPSLEPVFLANPFLNGGIAMVFVVGVIACFLQVFQLTSSVGWIESFANARDTARAGRTPRLLAPLAALLRSRGANRQISASSAASILESVATRIEEARDITRYLVSLLIFLGLLGTFYGLATTVPAVVETIRSLAPQEGEGGVEVFSRLMTGLEAQLGGMGTAFGSSLLGLAGSLVVGLLELFASRGQNRFYRELEEWLSTITRLGFAAAESEAESGADTGHVTAVLDYMAEQIESMRALVARAEESRATVDDRLAEVAIAMSELTSTLQHGDRTTEVLLRVAEGQEALLERIGPRYQEGELGDSGGDAESRMRLRSIDVQLLRILEELAAGRQEMIADLRGDLATLARELRKARGGGGAPPLGPAAVGGQRE